MAFDQSTRNRLARFVGHTRDLLTEEFTHQLRQEYGLDPAWGEVTTTNTLTNLDDAGRETARLLRQTMEHYLAGSPNTGPRAQQEALQRIVREQAFTVLNRLCALRMAEARGLLIESVARGYQSKGFQLYARLASTALGETGNVYRTYLASLFDEFAVDLPILFDRFSPQGRLFPREATLLTVLREISHPEIEPLWAEDETIGWIYQYFNSVEERRQMRAESQAPRDSRELAIRNQFFTPRYVVEYLVDNTLGRIWYEMTKGETALRNSCRYLLRRPNEVFLSADQEPPEPDSDQADLPPENLLKQTVHIPYRSIKDPRTILIMDPACGSMHFGLYAFDLFERIYEEAWNLQSEGNWTGPNPTALIEEYPSKRTLLRELPRLIIEHNIHGIDIDPRAVQIAGLSLWLRAQKCWHDQGLRASERPIIRRSNVVCAEPMPGETKLLDEFIEQQLSITPEDRVLAHLLRRVFEAMKLAGEAGSLLRIEREIAEAVEQAKEQWLTQPKIMQGRLFSDPQLAPQPEQIALGLDLTGITDASFWEEAEARIYVALRAYAEQADNGGGYQRRLFAGDAARGFAFIDQCRCRYDVAVMNPPFGQASKASSGYIKDRYGQMAVDLYAAFVARWLDAGTGTVGAITSRTGFFLPTFHEWRKHINSGSRQLDTCIDLGFGVLDTAAVETAAYCIITRSRSLPSVFIRLVAAANKETRLQDVADKGYVDPQIIFYVLARDFALIPLAPFSYWTTNRIRKLFHSLPPLCRDGRTAKVGLVTFDDFRFLRLAWEVPPSLIGRGNTWVRFAKGGEYQKWYSDIHLVVNWAYSASEMKALFTMLKEAGRLVPGLGPLRQFRYYFFPGITWPRSTAKGFNARALPSDVIFGDKGPSVLNEDGSQHELGVFLAVMNAPLFEQLILLQTASRAWEVGFVQRTPIPPLSETQITALETISRKACQEVMSVARQLEPNSLFVVPHTMRAAFEPKDSDPTAQTKDTLQMPAARLEEFEQAANELLRGAFSLSAEDVAALSPVIIEDITQSIKEAGDQDETDAPTPETSAADTLSYLLGVLYGRWNIRFATEEIAIPDLPNPFAPVPTCPPGMLQNADGLPTTRSHLPPDYPLRISWSGILVDDDGNPEDIASRIREGLQVVWHERGDAVEQEVCRALRVQSLRDYFRKPVLFFEDHLKRYSRSRRQAPIYWPLSTSGGAYTLWIFYHGITDQTLYIAVLDFVDPKLKAVSDAINGLQHNTGRSRKEEAELELWTNLEQELKNFRAELLRIAKFWKPNLNDGVQITAAPLWKLFQFRPWQRKLKETWEALEAGEYDWAHLAYSIWPDRVREKCKTDKSLAIAHGLEDQYVYLPSATKKRAGLKKKVAVEPPDELFGEG